MTNQDIPLKLPPLAGQSVGTIIQGRAPVVIMGPNGAGKTRFSTKLTGAPLARIPALRNLSQIADIPFQPPQAALDQLSAQAQSQFQNVWTLASDAQFALSAILSNNAKSAQEYCDAARKAGRADSPPPETQLTVLLRLWHFLLPGRQLKFEEHQPTVTNENSGTTHTYRAHTMSDGERVALYVAARVLLAPPGILVVDEPELHLHSVLARRLWTLLESERADCRLVYITHDLPFALSRRDASFVVLRSETDFQITTRQADLPDHIFRDIVGAATLTIASSKTVFCEGTPGKDDALYDALLARDGFQVVAVGSCANVEQCVEALRDAKIVRGGEALGLVDRDFWSAERIVGLKNKGVHAIEVHEVESLYLLQPCFEKVAAHVGAATDCSHAEFIRQAREFAQQDVVRVATERAKQRLFSELSHHIHKVPITSHADARKGLVDAIATRLAGVDAGKIFDEEERLVEAALRASVEDFLAVFPSKPLVGLAARMLGLSRERYFEILELLVRTGKDDDPARLCLREAMKV